MKLKNNSNFINYFKIKKNNQNNKLISKIQKVNTRIKDEKGKKNIVSIKPKTNKPHAPQPR